VCRILPVYSVHNFYVYSVQYFLFSFLECAELHARESRHVPLVVKVSNLYVLKNYLKGIVSPDWKGLQMVSLDRFEV
jgi:hypothetical protein